MSWSSSNFSIFNSKCIFVACSTFFFLTIKWFFAIISKTQHFWWNLVSKMNSLKQISLIAFQARGIKTKPLVIVLNLLCFLKGHSVIQVSSCQYLFIISFCRYSWKKIINPKSKISWKSDISFDCYEPNVLFYLVHRLLWHTYVLLKEWNSNWYNLADISEKGMNLQESFIHMIIIYLEGPISVSKVTCPPDKSLVRVGRATLPANQVHWLGSKWTSIHKSSQIIGTIPPILSLNKYFL